MAGLERKSQFRGNDNSLTGKVKRGNDNSLTGKVKHKSMRFSLDKK